MREAKSLQGKTRIAAIMTSKGYQFRIQMLLRDIKNDQVQKLQSLATLTFAPLNWAFEML